MWPISAYRWITLHDFLRQSFRPTIEELPLDRPEHEIGQRVTLKQEGYYYLITNHENDSEEEYFTGRIIAKKRIDQEELDRFREEQQKKFKPTFLPTVERVCEMMQQLFLGRMVYSVHLDELEEGGSDIFFSLPWPWPELYENNICSDHGEKEYQYHHMTCHLTAI